MRKIVLETDILEEADKKFESGEWLRNGRWAVPNPAYQPERSKREDSCKLTDLQFYWDAKKQEMRCSEHDGNAVREVQ